MPRGERVNRWLLGLLIPALLAFAWWTKDLQLSTPTWMSAMAAAASERRIPIYSVATDQPRLAISFDAAWGADKTPELLKTLEEFDVKTTFFLVSFWVEDYPEMARAIADAGHEIGMHSATHPDFTALSQAQMRAELKDNFETIVRVTGQRPRLFRPPFGAYNNRVMEVVEDQEGFTTIQWSVDSLDWKDVTPEFITQRVLERSGPGDIVLFHNNAESTPRALPEILSAFRRQGYQVVPIGELIHDPPYRVDHQGRQSPAGRAGE